MTRYITIAYLLFLSGCGTVTSLSNSDSEIERDLKAMNTSCEQTSRAYGGVSYNLCLLNSNPGGSAIDFYLGLYLLDTGVSAITDTIALPYTIPQQSKKGSIKIAE